tara:strand:- start:1702 stop:1932 length:231 start_codon:yes stop_codon:yes gene_type:complete
MDYFEKTMQERFKLANDISRAKYKLLDIAIQGLMALKEEGNKVATLTLEEMAKSIPEELEIDTAKFLNKALGIEDR